MFYMVNLPSIIKNRGLRPPVQGFERPCWSRDIAIRCSKNTNNMAPGVTNKYEFHLVSSTRQGRCNIWDHRTRIITNFQILTVTFKNFKLPRFGTSKTGWDLIISYDPDITEELFLVLKRWIVVQKLNVTTHSPAALTLTDIYTIFYIKIQNATIG